MALGGALVTIYYNIDAVMLSKLDTFRAVGIYGIGYKFAGIVNFVPQALTVAVLGLLVRSWPHDPDTFWSTLRRATALVGLCGVLVLVEFGLFAGPAIRLLYGERYVQGADAARLVVAGSCVAFFTQLGLTILVAMGRDRLYPLAGAIGVAANVGLNLFLIPAYSYRGAAWATLITELLVSTALWIPVVRLADRPVIPVAQLAKAAVAGGVAAGCAALTYAVAPWLLAAVVGLVVYALLLHAARIPGPEGLRSLLNEAAA